MASTRILLLRQLISSKFSFQPRKISVATPHFNSLVINRLYDSQRLPSGRAPSSQLSTRISLVGSSNISVIPLLDQWVEEGYRVQEFELRRIIRLLRSRNRHSQALEVSKWTSTKKLSPFLSSDRALKLDLIGKVRGLHAAESYFNETEEKSERIYGSLLSCYVSEGLAEKSISHFEMMKKMGIAKCCLSYNGIMTLYTKTGQLEKVPDVLSEMQKNGVLPDEVSYTICMKSYGSRSDF